MLIALTKSTWVELSALSVVRHDRQKRSLSVLNRNGGVLITLMNDEADEAAAAVQSFIDGMKADYLARQGSMVQAASG
jgi:hypothetical protein